MVYSECHNYKAISLCTVQRVDRREREIEEREMVMYCPELSCSDCTYGVLTERQQPSPRHHDDESSRMFPGKCLCCDSAKKNHEKKQLVIFQFLPIPRRPPFRMSPPPPRVLGCQFHMFVIILHGARGVEAICYGRRNLTSETEFWGIFIQYNKALYTLTHL